MIGGSWLGFRELVEEPEATKSIQRLASEHERFEEQWIGLSWLIARQPEKRCVSKIVSDVKYYLMHRKGDPEYGLVDIAVIYQFDDQRVTIIDVNAWESFDYE